MKVNILHEDYPIYKAIENYLDSASGLDMLIRDKIINKGRKREFVQSRQMLMSILCENTNWSLQKIGNNDIIAGFDHATVMHAKTKISDLCFSDLGMRVAYDEYNTAFKDSLALETELLSKRKKAYLSRIHSSEKRSMNNAIKKENERSAKVDAEHRVLINSKDCVNAEFLSIKYPIEYNI